MAIKLQWVASAYDLRPGDIFRPELDEDCHYFEVLDYEITHERCSDPWSRRVAHSDCYEPVTGPEQGLTPCHFGPILIYRKEVRVARADRAGTGFVDNSIALISCGNVGAGPRAANTSYARVGSSDTCARSHPLPSPRCR